MKWDGGEEKPFVKTLKGKRKIPSKIQNADSQPRKSQSQLMCAADSGCVCFYKQRKKPASVLQMKIKNCEADGLT